MAVVRVMTNPGSASTHAAIVNCPAGQIATGGGGQINGANSNLTDSRPVLDEDGQPRGWQVKANNGAPAAWVVCAQQ